MDERRVAGIVYNETSGLRAGGAGEGVLSDAREKIAQIVIKRGGQGVAAPKIPNAQELRYPPARAAWDDSLAAARRAAGQDCGDCRHFVLWPSSDGQSPTENPRMRAGWPYTEASKIGHRYGPFQVPVKVGDVPVGDSIYIFVYCGVR